MAVSEPTGQPGGEHPAVRRGGPVLGPGAERSAGRGTYTDIVEGHQTSSCRWATRARRVRAMADWRPHLRGHTSRGLSLACRASAADCCGCYLQFLLYGFRRLQFISIRVSSLCPYSWKACSRPDCAESSQPRNDIQGKTVEFPGLESKAICFEFNISRKKNCHWRNENRCVEGARLYFC
jgi:hypothetical protein